MEQFNFLIMGENRRFEIKSLPTEGMTFFTKFGWFDDLAVVLFYNGLYRVVHAETGFCIMTSSDKEAAIKASEILLIDMGEKAYRNHVQRSIDTLKLHGIKLPINDLNLLNQLNYNLKLQA